MRLRIALLAVFTTIVPAMGVTAQTPVDSAVLRLNDGERIRISLLGNRWVGELRRVGGDTVFLGPTDHPMAVRFNAIDTLWRRGSYERVGSKIGMVTLGLLGAAAVVATAVGSAEGGQSTRASDVGVALLAGAAGTAIGWFGGAIIGSAFPRWHQLYPVR